MALYMIGFISYGATLVLYSAVFPRLARNTQHIRDLREKYDRGDIPVEVYEREESLEKNRISNISTVWISFSPQCSLCDDMIGRLTAISVMWLYLYSTYRSYFPLKTIRKLTTMSSSCEIIWNCI